MKHVHTGIAAVAASTLLMPVAAFAEGSGSAGGAEILIPKPAEFVPALIIFLVIWFLLAKFVWPKVMSTLESREEHIEKSIEEAEQTKAAAVEVRNEADTVVADARRKASDIVLSARSDAEKERARIVADAHVEAEDIITKARERAVDEQRRMYDNATDSIAKVSVAVASKIVGDKLAEDKDLQRDIIKKYIAEVGNLNA
ncbi:MAG: F0F1 ATP synthase subunit B [Coriobacteriaceae bacterium]|nr:F0F1 ATP synthase subunit B [Coriobacteriaceae bacterium]